MFARPAAIPGVKPKQDEQSSRRDHDDHCPIIRVELRLSIAHEHEVHDLEVVVCRQQRGQNADDRQAEYIPLPTQF